SEITRKYKYSDKLSSNNAGIIYYRLKGTDLNGRVMQSDVRIVRLGKTTNEMSITAYPNPTINEIRVTIPNSWQNQEVTYQIYNANGLVVKQEVKNKAGQTEVMPMNNLTSGIYIVKVSNGLESAIQRIVKIK